MQLVKRLRVRGMHWDHSQSCKLILHSADPYRQEKGTHSITPEVAATFGILLDQGLIGCDIEYTLRHRMLIGERLPTPESLQPEEFVVYGQECEDQKTNTVLLDEVQRNEKWGWLPSAGYRPKDPLHHQVHYILKVTSSYYQPACSLQVELTDQEYEECTKLLPGSVFDLTLRLIPEAEVEMY